MAHQANGEDAPPSYEDAIKYSAKLTHEHLEKPITINDHQPASLSPSNSLFEIEIDFIIIINYIHESVAFVDR